MSEAVEELATKSETNTKDLSREKKIQIRRREPKSHLPTPIIANSDKTIGSIFDGRSPLSGLSREEERKYLPELIGAYPEDRNWGEKVREYWASFFILVPQEGVVLDISLKPNGEPVNLRDWIKWKWCKAHVQVADNRKEMRRHPQTKKYYIHDPEKVDRKKENDANTRMVAYKQLIRLLSKDTEDSKKKSRRIYRVLTGADPRALSDGQLKTSLESEVNMRPKEFLEVFNDKDLDHRATINELLDEHILDRTGTHITFNGDIIGENMTEAIQFFKAKSNSQTVNMLKSRLKQARS